MERDLQVLFGKLMRNQCSPEEVDQVISLLNEHEAVSGRLIQQELARKVADHLLDEQLRKRLDRRLEYILQTKTRSGSSLPISRKLAVLRPLLKYAAAACILLGTGAGIYFFYSGSAFRHAPELAEGHDAGKDLAPGGSKATLTLANGSSIYLDDAAAGEIAREQGALIHKKAGGELVYDQAGGSRDASPAGAYHTLTTPRGGQYQLNLPDGTRVWLNAASSLRYPASFTGKERQVMLSGEAYFEVAEDKERPFRVMSGAQVVEVLGTRFNITAYEDEEAVRTTLVQGAVAVSAEGPGAGKSRQVLKPGEESNLGENGVLTVGKGDIEMALAWKNGFFHFRKARIETVMQTLARWYDVEVAYEGEVPQRVFTGKLYRNVNASQVLDILEYFEVDFRIGDGKITISPK